MRRFVFALSAVAMVGALLASLAFAATHRHHQRGATHVRLRTVSRSLPPGFVEGTAMQIASVMGDGHPTAREFIYVNRGVAASFVDAGTQVDSNEPVFLVVLHGHFVFRNAHIPAGASLPTGTEADFTVDPASHQIIDSGVSNQLLDLGVLAASGRALGAAHSF